jgi:hypothetical protein
MPAFEPKLSVLPPAQRRLWEHLRATPDHFVLYGGTALALRLGHRTSVDFDFFSNQNFDPDALERNTSFLKGAERIQSAANTLTCRVGQVLVSFFGGLDLGKIARCDVAAGIAVASALDLAGTKVAVIQKRAEAKDYIDIDALMESGLDLATMLAAGRAIYGEQFNALISLKALSYFGDVPTLPAPARDRLLRAVATVDLANLPHLKPVVPRPGSAAR